MGTFPTDILSTSQLQRAALAPELWNTHLRHMRDFHTPLETEMCTLARPEIQADRHSYNRVYFVPGGRYLVEEAKTTVSLWDLGMPLAVRDAVQGVEAGRTLGAEGKAVLEPTLLDLFVLEAREKEWDPIIEDMIVTPAGDGSKLRICLVSTDCNRKVEETYK